MTKTKLPLSKSKIYAEIEVLILFLYFRVHKGEPVYAIDCGDEAALWLSRYILEKDSGLRLGYNDGSKKRNISAYNNLLDYYKNLRSSSMVKMF